MGHGVRVYYIGENELPHKFPYSRLNRLLDGKERKPEFANRRVRFATVHLETENRLPLRILLLESATYTFDKSGKIDKQAMSELQRDSASLYRAHMERSGFEQREKQSSNLIDAGEVFIRKQYDNKHRWSPSDEILTYIQRDIFGNTA